MDDPIVREMLRFTLLYGRWIALAIVVAAVISAVSALSKPAQYSMRAVYTAATTATEGPVESFELAVRRSTNRVAEAIGSGELPPGTWLDAHGLMGEPPNLETTHLVEMTAVGPTPDAVRKAIFIAGDELAKGQREVFDVDRERILRHVAAVEADLARVEALAPTRERHELYIKEVRELIDSARYASPVRAYEPRFVGIFEPVLEDKMSQISFPLALGISGGIAGGYALAFVLAGVSAFLRHRRRLA